MVCLEDLKVGLSELKEQLETLEEPGYCQTGKVCEKPKALRIFRQGENEVYFGSLARWDTQLKGLAELDRRCLDLMQEVQLLSERQEVLVGMVASKRNMQKETPQKYQEKVFEEFKELEEKLWNSCKKKAYAHKWEGESERARMLRRLGGSRAVEHWNEARDIMSVESCSLSMARDIEEVCSESLRR